MRAVPLVDGSWFDICSLAVAILYATLRWYRARPHQKAISKATGLDVANGVSLFPLFMLVLATLSTSALASVLQSNRLILSVAGVVALLAILEDA